MLNQDISGVEGCVLKEEIVFVQAVNCSEGNSKCDKKRIICLR